MNNKYKVILRKMLLYLLVFALTVLLFPANVQIMAEQDESTNDNTIVEKANIKDITINTKDALRTNIDKTRFVIDETGKISFSTNKLGIAIFDEKNEIIKGGEYINNIDINESMTIDKIKLYYKAENEILPCWHNVEYPSTTIVVDNNLDTLLCLVEAKNKPNENDYYNQNANFSVEVEKTKDLSGIKKIEYFVTCDNKKYEQNILYEYNECEAIIDTIRKDFEIDSNIYNSDNVKITLTVTDRANNKKTIETFLKINSTCPNISIDISGKKLSSAVDKYYGTDRQLIITINDRTDTFDKETFLNGLKIYNDNNKIELSEKNVNIKSYENGIHIVQYVFKENGKYTWSLEYTNKAGLTNNEIALTGEDVYEFYIDKDAPKIELTYDNNKVINRKYFDKNRTATVIIKEDNFNPLFVDFNVTINGEKEILYQDYLRNKSNWTKDGTSYKATLPEFIKEGKYTITISCKDFSENKSETKDVDVKNQETPFDFVIDKTNPEIQVIYDNNDVKNLKYFNKNRKARIVIKDNNFNPEFVDALVEVNGIANEGYTSLLKNKATWNNEGDLHTAYISYTKEADYNFKINCKDYANRKNNNVDVKDSKAAYNFIIDKTAPDNLDIQIDKKSMLGNKNNITFKTFYRNKVNIKLLADCNISGVHSLKYQKVDVPSKYKENENWIAYEKTNGITVSPNEKFILYFRAEDKASNVSIVNSKGIIVDNKRPVGEKEAPEIDIIPETSNNNGFYNKNVNVAINVVDPKYVGINKRTTGYCSGINMITYKIYTLDTNEVEEGTLFDVKKSSKGAVLDKDKLASNWSGKINVSAEKFNSNNVIIEIKAIDNAGNMRITTSKKNEIKIDKTAPTINVSYNNNSLDSETYFKKDRQATITITERNFKPELAKLYITNSKGQVPSLSGWTKTEGTGNKDNTKWSATINYSLDGDYDFEIECTDLANLKCSKENVSYGDSLSPKKFTIDKTVPIVNVTYNNDRALNNNYYKNKRVANIVIKEHNLDPNGADKGRIKVTMTRTDNGQSKAVPNISGWTTQQDMHTATIAYDDDGLYTFDIEVKDKAGNEAADFTKQSFYIDKTSPKLNIINVKDNQAISGKVMPEISYSDINFNNENVKITLTGANRRNVKLDGKFVKTVNGGQFVFNDFPNKKEIDDIYTLTAAIVDKAGNETKKSINFSVNRFGSTYEISDDTKKINNTYVQKGQDVVLSEINADKLNDIKVVVYKNNETITLKENLDYTLDIEGGNGNWYKYIYTIKAKNFEDDAAYRIAVHSKDASGNVAENTLDTKNLEIAFGVDKTKPEILVSNLESNQTYALDKKDVNVSLSDNMILDNAKIYLDNMDIPYASWNEEEINKIIKENKNFEFNINGDSTKPHLIKVVCTDKAGNKQIEEIKDFYVTTNLWVRYYNNKPLFYGSIAGVIILLGLAVFIIVYKNKKKN